MADNGRPLAGLRVVEMSAIGPVPLAARMLADLGADVVRIERAGDADLVAGSGQEDLYAGRPSAALNLKAETDTTLARQVIASAHVVVEGFRPGVMERLGLGPNCALADNPGLVYVRVTGWGQDGPLAQRAGHDINYIALTGALHTMGEAGGKPQAPMNLLGDFGGGAMLAVVGALAGVVAVRSGASGHVVDAAMVDGTATLMSMAYAMLGAGRWVDERGSNALDGGAPFYDTYRCADGGWLAVGALEPQFWAALLGALATSGVDTDALPSRDDPAHWPALKEALCAVFASRSRAEWVEVFDGTDACVSPVLSMTEAPDHPANVARRVFTAADGPPRPAAAPRFNLPYDTAAPTAYDLATTLSRWSVEPSVVTALTARETTR